MAAIIPATKELAQLYLNRVKKERQRPNFWMSEEYILKKELSWVSCGEFSGFMECGDMKTWFFPPVWKDTRLAMTGEIYSSFVEDGQISLIHFFLDKQFLYNPIDFLAMEGKQWAVFRKNIRKYPKRFGGVLTYDELYPCHFDAVEDFIMKTTLAQKESIYDAEIFIDYCLNGEHRKGLFNDGQLVGINIWDENFLLINFRYCVDDGTQFLNEYMRFLFYTDKEIRDKHKLVNDGGCLDNPNLEKFKRKLNPTKIMMVCSYGKDFNNESQS